MSQVLINEAIAAGKRAVKIAEEYRDKLTRAEQRIAELESAVRGLVGRNAQLEGENAALRRAVERKNHALDLCAKFFRNDYWDLSDGERFDNSIVHSALAYTGHDTAAPVNPSPAATDPSV